MITDAAAFKLNFTLAGIGRVLRAIATNQVAGWFPGWYVRITGQTGRGSEPETPAQVAAYFRTCFDDYRARLAADGDIVTCLAGKTVLEYGPGDMPGVALLLLAHGAAQVICVDRFPMLQLSARNAAVLAELLAGLDDAARARVRACLRDPDDPAQGFRPERLRYQVQASGLSELSDAVDLIISRAVLEHVNDLPASFADMYRALRPGGRMLHQVDLRSHGLHRQHPLDFLVWPVWLWNLMFSNKGTPNRWRVDRYRALVAQSGFVDIQVEATHRLESARVEAIRAHLAAPFRTLPAEDLAWLGCWLAGRKPSGATV